jgi:hypothetical protein
MRVTVRRGEHHRIDVKVRKGELRFSQAATHEALALPALNPDFLYAARDATAYAAFVKESRKKRPSHQAAQEIRGSA